MFQKSIRLLKQALFFEHSNNDTVENLHTQNIKVTLCQQMTMSVCSRVSMTTVLVGRLHVMHVTASRRAVLKSSPISIAEERKRQMEKCSSVEP